MPILSIDIHPDGTRLATGGQGRDSGLVVLWNTDAVLDQNSENDENVPKILCQVRIVLRFEVLKNKDILFESIHMIAGR